MPRKGLHPSVLVAVCTIAHVCFASITTAHAEDVQKNTTVGIDPFYTGSLLSPSPAAPRAGLFAYEPYVFYTINPGSYTPRGGAAQTPNHSAALQTLTLMKYGITDSLSIQILPQSSNNYDQRGFDSGSRVSDFPVELEYLLTRQDKKTGKPSLTVSAGVDTPTGRFDHLPNAADGQGTGVYRARLGIVAQSLLYGESRHPVRVRAYATGAVPLGGTDVHGISVYGTDNAFNGYAKYGLSGSFGASVEYSFTQRLVFAFDVLYSLSASNHVYGSELGGLTVATRSGSSDNIEIAPALEYSFNDNIGIIAGCALTVEGHNSTQVVQPQIAFNFVLDTTKPFAGIPAAFSGL